MMPDGRLERVAPGAGEDPHSAATMVRFAPRQVTLQPGESQKVRVAVQKPPGLQAGEYRSHIQFEAVPQGSSAPAISRADSLVIRFNVIGAVTIPVIVRQGQLSASATFDRVSFAEGTLNASLRRSGDRSLRGDLTVYLVGQAGKKRLEVGKLREFAVYVPNEFRLVRIPLKLPPSAKGKLQVVFEEIGIGKARAEAEIPLSSG